MPTRRKTDDEHALNGTVSQADPDAPLTEGRPRCPKSLSPDARRSFRALCRTLAARRSLTGGDQEILRLYAVLFDRHRQALEHIADEGAVREYTRLDNHGQPVETFAKNIWLPIAQECEAKMISILDRLGLTPVNRPRVKPTKSEADAAITFL